LYVVNHSAMLANNHSIVANPRCYKCEVTSYYLKKWLTFTDGDSGIEGPVNRSVPFQYIANIRDGSVIGYKYFNFAGPLSISIRIRGRACGTVGITIDDSKKIGNSDLAAIMAGRRRLIAALCPIENRFWLFR
jgi:hypothetical protein